MAGVLRIDDSIHLIDLDFQGVPGVIGAYLIDGGDEKALVEIGPTSTLDSLLTGLTEAGTAPEEIGKILVTHIHLDHAGGAGTFIRRFPQARLYVHEVGASHMVDPLKLWHSASRIYGDMMEPLWGSIEPIPADKIVSMGDNVSIQVGRLALTAVYTPGHASHHVAYHDADRDVVLTGDVAAVRLQGVGYVRPPTPPPDIDLEAWDRSLDRLRDLRPRRLLLTHFGPFDDVAHHLDAAQQRLHAWADVVRRAEESGQGRPEIVDNLMLHGNRELMAVTTRADALQAYELATPYGMTVDGYLRYFRKAAAASEGAKTASKSQS
ncbi:MAG TPA: MBL fold metallo-hydrolase [Chloroflexota bacterium]|nr:MBL fold metallo-hydrolase [Chloroflexota bacterium]